MVSQRSLLDLSADNANIAPLPRGAGNHHNAEAVATHVRSAYDENRQQIAILMLVLKRAKEAQMDRQPYFRSVCRSHEVWCHEAQMAEGSRSISVDAVLPGSHNGEANVGLSTGAAQVPNTRRSSLLLRRNGVRSTAGYAAWCQSGARGGCAFR